MDYRKLITIFYQERRNSVNTAVDKRAYKMPAWVIVIVVLLILIALEA